LSPVALETSVTAAAKTEFYLRIIPTLGWQTWRKELSFERSFRIGNRRGETIGFACVVLTFVWSFILPTYQRETL
jgi:hypothetical protein